MGDHLLESNNSITIILEASSAQYKDTDEQSCIKRHTWSCTYNLITHFK